MKPDDIDSRLLGTNLARIPLPVGVTTYRSLANAHGSVIDHIVSNEREATSKVSEDGAFIGDHFPIIGSLRLRAKASNTPVKIEARIPPNLQAGDVGGLRRLNQAMMKHFTGDASNHSIEDITEWTVKQARAIAASRNSRNNPNGWSPLSRLLHLRLRALGALYKRIMDGSGIGPCYRLYMDARRDSTHVSLNDDEANRLVENDIEKSLPEWRVWQRDMDKERLRAEIQRLRNLSTRERRNELRILHGGRMRRIQDAADVGKIGAMLKGIMAKSTAFSMDVLYDKDKNIVDANEISHIITEFF